MSDATGEFRAIVASLVVVGVATIFLVLCVWPPPHPNNAYEAQQQQQQQQQQAAGGGRYNNNNNNEAGGELNKPQPREACTKTPNHVSTASAKIAHSGGANLLVDGLVAFRHTKAAALGSVEKSTTTTTTPEQAALNRKDRARILSRLLDGAPPMKGGTLLVSIPAKDVGCEKLARVLFLLASFYNLLVILAIEPPETEPNTTTNNNNKTNENDPTKLLKERLRCGSILLSKDVLPDHRILCSSTTTGRVALARQLQRVELILEYDATVRQNLQRFGHTVVLYNNNNSTNSTTTTPVVEGGVSMLGQTLL